jgi:hypothetical protein
MSFADSKKKEKLVDRMLEGERTTEELAEFGGLKLLEGNLRRQR